MSYKKYTIRKILKYSLFRRKQKRLIITTIIFFICIILIYILSLNFSIELIKKLNITQNQFKLISNDFKQNIYEQCRSFSDNIHLLQPKQNNITQDIYIFLHYSSNKNDDNELYLQIATSYLLSQNLQQLSYQQQIHTYIIIFLYENYTNDIYIRLEQWFKSIYTPYTSKTQIIPIKNTSQSLWKLIINYIKSNKNIQFETILFFLENNYIYEIDMLFDTIEFFINYNPCFVYQTDNPDRCQLDTNDDIGHVVLPGKERMWISVSSITTTTYVCRLKTFLAFEDLLINSNDDIQLGQKIRNRMNGKEIFFCSNPSYSAQIETLLLPNEINITINEDMAVYFKDWQSIAQRAFAEAEKMESFPYSKINKGKLFIH